MKIGRKFNWSHNFSFGDAYVTDPEGNVMCLQVGEPLFGAHEPYMNTLISLIYYD